MNALIIDGYVDEPACFGVPPYISPYVRYCAGALFPHGFDIAYTTCDAWRATRCETEARLTDSDLVIVVMGLTVPGRYRGGSPLTLRELEELASLRRRGDLVLAGPVHNGYTLRGGARAAHISPAGVDFTAVGDPELSLDLYCRTGQWHEAVRRDYGFLDRIAPLGAAIVRQHPAYPDVIAELELSRGCDRVDGHCAFCTEGAGATYAERGAEGIAREAAALDASGVRAFRLGRCANLLAWGGARTPTGYRPDAKRIGELYSRIRAAAPALRVLHADNANPATIARFPDEARACLAEIVRHNTPGDGLSLGIESLDPAVRRANNLKVSYEEALEAVRAVNEIGGFRPHPRSLPALLPGLNFISGLAGDTKEGIEWNRRFLQALLDEGLAVRRINIRQTMVFPDSALSEALAASPSRIDQRAYRRWKEWVRGEIDPAMLARVAPLGTILEEVIVEERRGNVVFGRQLGSYPPLVGIASERLRPGEKADVMIVAHGGRSLTAVPFPLDINRCSPTELTALPGIGRARARTLIKNRPYRDREGMEKALDALDAQGLVEKLSAYFDDPGRD